MLLAAGMAAWAAAHCLGAASAGHHMTIWHPDLRLVSVLKARYAPICYVGTDVVEMLLGAGADADLRDGLGGSALLGAAQAGHHRTIDALTARGAACAPLTVL